MFRNKKIYLDGGMGSLLLSKGLSGPSELHNINNPNIVKEIHQEYISSGSDVIYTNTFGINTFKYSDEQAKTLIQAGIKIAKEASNNNCLVALDIGSMGKLIGSGGYSFEEIYNAYKKIVCFAEDKTDFIVVETINDLVECRTALLAIKENSKLPVVVSMSFENNGKTVFGNPISSFSVICESLGADALGINCSLSAKDMLNLAKELIKSLNGTFLSNWLEYCIISWRWLNDFSVNLVVLGHALILRYLLIALSKSLSDVLGNCFKMVSATSLSLWL